MGHFFPAMVAANGMKSMLKQGQQASMLDKQTPYSIRLKFNDNLIIRVLRVILIVDLNRCYRKQR